MVARPGRRRADRRRDRPGRARCRARSAVLVLKRSTNDDVTLPTGAAARSGAPLIAHRYEVGALVGRGGQGQVHAAHDRVTGDTVAIKFVRALGVEDRRRLRRELAALRLLRLPGVVRLRDDGEQDGQTFLVMDLLPGGSISQLAGPWDSWAAAGKRLLETLATVHGAGVFHRDLKPPNVLLDGQRMPVIVDFGLARGTGVAELGVQREGSPGYIAPEQRRGSAPAAASDLYAVGVLFHELLTGRPYRGLTRDALAERAPPAVVDVVVALLSEAPGDRPDSAATALERLGFAPVAVPAVPAVRQIVRRLFDEPRETFLHVATDAAALLWARGEGDPARMSAELGSWVRRGEAAVRDGRIVMGWDSLERVRRTSTVPLTGEALGPWADRALQAARDDLDRGRPSAALGELESIATAVQELDPERRARWLAMSVDAALWLESDTQLGGVLYHLDRVGEGLPEVEGWRRLVQGARAAWAKELTRAEPLLADATPLGAEVFEVWRRALRVRVAAAGPLDHHRTVVQGMRSWAARSDDRMAAWLTWAGHLAYRAGRYRQAAGLHRRAAGLQPHRLRKRAGSLYSAAEAALDGTLLSDALTDAVSARRVACGARSAVIEVLAFRVQRAARYRLEQPLRPALRWVDASEPVATGAFAQLAVTEAAVAYRRGDRETSGQLALRAWLAFSEKRLVNGLALAGTLAAHVGYPVSESAALIAHCRAAAPGIRLQSLALLRAVDPEAVDEAGPWVAPAGNRRDRSIRREILSIDEASELMAGATECRRTAHPPPTST